MSNHIPIGRPTVESVVRIFQCKEGHEIRVNSPFSIGWYADQDPAIFKPICPICLSNFCRNNFPMEEVQQTRIEPVSPQLPMTRSGDGLAVQAVPCTTEGCILMRHPAGTDHMNSGKLMFKTAEEANITPKHL